MKFPDPVAFGQALAKIYEKAQPVLQHYLQKNLGDFSAAGADPMNIRKAYFEFLQAMMLDPGRFWALQMEFWNEWMNLYQDGMRKFMGAKTDPFIIPERTDRRFRDSAWQDVALFDFIKQSYLFTCRWMIKIISETKEMDEKSRKKLEFAAQLYANAFSPSNFILTNPEVIKETLESGGENLIRGFENLLEDLRRGGGELQISTTKYEAFELGKNVALTPGRVIYRNELIELIQYEPATKEVFKRPLLIVPPWINKYYILDLRPENSMIRWLVEQGHTVFTISWINPGPELAQKQFEDYMEEGILAALDVVQTATGEHDCNVIGYCIGGTLLAMTLAYLKAKNQDKRVASATFLTTLIDFADSGDLGLFVDDEQLEQLDRQMAEKGLLEARQLQRTFSLLRANDLIWSFVVNNYLLGKEPFPFDLLYWNDDSTNMPAAMHSVYLRSMYRYNLLTKPDAVTLNGVPIDIRTVETPCYFLSTKEDHIAPWQATYAGARLMRGPVRFTLAASGHIAGVINPPAKKKYGFWQNEALPADPEEWLRDSRTHTGSWWPHWQAYMRPYAGEKVKARKPAKGLEKAPGSYVRKKS